VYFPAAALVARVATLTAWTRRDPFRWLAREVAVARHVAGRGGPVVPPARSIDPGPHWQDGFAISLWEYVAPPSAVRGEAAPAECGALLARFHEAALGCPAELGNLAPATEQVTDALAVIERERLADTVTIAQLRAVHERVLADIKQAGEWPWIVIHGDAHSGNLIAARAGGWLWTDLEETSCGPAGWDLATMTSRYGDTASQQAALRGYAAEAGTAVPQPGELAPFRRARDLEAAAWLVCMAHLYPDRYATRAREHLSAVLTNGLSRRPGHDTPGMGAVTA
jgi:Ser/Thr protein kinase RdoA (MazF antagonist)